MRGQEGLVAELWKRHHAIQTRMLSMVGTAPQVEVAELSGELRALIRLIFWLNPIHPADDHGVILSQGTYDLGFSVTGTMSLCDTEAIDNARAT